jgi:hypothetical protein
MAGLEGQRYLVNGVPVEWLGYFALFVLSFTL